MFVNKLEQNRQKFPCQIFDKTNFIPSDKTGGSLSL